MHYAFFEKGPKMFNIELLFLDGFSSKHRKILHKVVLTPQEYEDFFGEKLRKHFSSQDWSEKKPLTKNFFDKKQFLRKHPQIAKTWVQIL